MKNKGDLPLWLIVVMSLGSDQRDVSRSAPWKLRETSLRRRSAPDPFSFFSPSPFLMAGLR